MGERRFGNLVRAGALGLSVLAVVAATSCGTKNEPTSAAADPTTPEAPVDGGSLAFGVNGDAQGWNPHYSAPAHAPAMMLSSMLEPLAAMGEDGSTQPYLATTWTPNATFDEWTVDLRDDVTFQNGEKFDAEAVRLNTLDAVSGAVSSQAIKGMITDVVAVDSDTVTFQLAQPWAAFPGSYLSSPLTMMMAPAAIKTEDHGNAEPIGTGPFAFQDWVAGDHLTVVKNPTYWQEGQPHVDEIEFKIIGDPRSRANALISGDIDLMVTTSALDADQLASDDYHVIKDWGSQQEMVVLNAGETVGGVPNPLHNEHARRALAHATDQHAIADSVGEGLQTPTSPFDPDGPWAVPDDQSDYPSFDLDAARDELRQYTEDTGEDTLRFSLLSTPDPEALAVAQTVQSQWKEAGIEAQIETIEASAYTGKAITGAFNAAILAIYNSPDPDQDHYFWSSDTIGGDGAVNINLQQYSTPKMDEDLKVGREQADPDTRKAAYTDLVQQLNQASVNLWLYSTPYSLAADPRVKGLEQAESLPLANYQFKPWLGQIWLSDANQ